MPQNATAQTQQQKEQAPATPQPQGSGDLTVAQIATSLADTGPTEDVIAMAEHLLHENCRSVVFSSGGARLEGLLKTGSEHFEMGFKEKYGFFAAMGMGLKLSQRLSACKADVVHLHSQNLIWPVYIACQLSKKPLLVKVDDPLGSVRHAPLSLLKKVPLLSPTQSGKEELIRLGVPEEMVTVIPPGYNSLKYLPEETEADKVDKLWSEWDVPSATRVMYIPTRQLEESVGLATFIHALEPLKQMPFKAVISGDYSHNRANFAELWQQVETRGLSKHVLFIGTPHDPVNTYAAADVVVCPQTYTPPISRAPLQGQAMGKPVIASDLDAHREMIKDGESGWLFNSGDHRKLTEVLKKALADQIRLHKMGTKGARRVSEKNSYKTTCPAVYYLYRTLVPTQNLKQKKAR